MTHRLSSAAGRAAHAQGCPSPACTGVDLHLHSTFSDGLRTPEELCRLARKAHVGTLALTDHDTAQGVPAMRQAAQAEGLAFIPGAEISTGAGGRVHVLCYGECVLSAEMERFLQKLANERIGRAAEILGRLARQGMPLPEEERSRLLRIPTVGRAHIARSLITLGAVNTTRQAFDRYLGEGRPAYVPRALLPTSDAVETLSRMGAVTVLAHPMRMGLELPSLHALIASLRECGLHGVEAFHPSANSRDARQLDGLARQMQLLVTGGSDYHGDPSSTVHIGRLSSGWQRRDADLSALIHLLSLHLPR